MAFPPATISTAKTNATVQQTDHPNHHNALADGVNDITAFLTPKTASAIVTAGYTGSIELRRTGFVVECSILVARATPLSVDNDLAGGAGIGTIPIGFEPGPAWNHRGVAYYTDDATATSTGELLTLVVNAADRSIRMGNHVDNLRQIRASLVWLTTAP